MFGGKALGWMAGTLIWMPGARRASVSSYSAVTASPLSSGPCSRNHRPLGNAATSPHLLPGPLSGELYAVGPVRWGGLHSWEPNTGALYNGGPCSRGLSTGGLYILGASLDLHWHYCLRHQFGAALGGAVQRNAQFLRFLALLFSSFHFI